MATRWSPDTCGCVVEFEINGDDPVFSASIMNCKKHVGLKGQTHLDTVLAHNRAKNEVLNHLIQDGGLTMDQVTVTYEDDDQFRIVGISPEADSKIAASIARLPADKSAVVRGLKKG